MSCRSLLHEMLNVQALEWMKMSASMSANRTRTRHVKILEAFRLRLSSSDCPSMDLAHRPGMRLAEAAKASRHEGVVCCVASCRARSIACELQFKVSEGRLYVLGSDHLQSR